MASMSKLSQKVSDLSYSLGTIKQRITKLEQLVSSEDMRDRVNQLNFVLKAEATKGAVFTEVSRCYPGDDRLRRALVRAWDLPHGWWHERAEHSIEKWCETLLDIHENGPPKFDRGKTYDQQEGGAGE